MRSLYSAFLRCFDGDEEVNILEVLHHIEDILQERAVSLDGRCGS